MKKIEPQNVSISEINDSKTWLPKRIKVLFLKNPLVLNVLNSKTKKNKKNSRTINNSTTLNRAEQNIKLNMSVSYVTYMHHQ